MMKPSYIVYTKRTSIGKINGVLSSVRVDDLLSYLFEDFKKWAKFPLNEIDDCIVGCANQAGEDNRNIARMALILAGFPLEIPGTTINRLCGSSLDAIIDASSRVTSGIAECILVGGAESMTRAPYALSKATTSFGRDQKLYDTSLGWRFPNSRMEKMFPLFSMGETAEEVANLFKISREDQDKFAHHSHLKASQADFTEEILPITIHHKKGEDIIKTDECIRRDSTLESLSKLKPSFRNGGSVTPGNSSPMNDGASMVLVVSEGFLKRHKLTPQLEITGGAARGVHPNTMGLGPIESTKVLCKKFGKKIEDFDVIELNEAFAAQALACIKELGIDPQKVNLKGGAIALGHPLGCSGARLVTTMSHIMKENSKLKQGLATMCIGVGQGISLSVKNCY